MEQLNLLATNWLLQKKSFIDNLVTSRKRPTKDSVHHLRVAVKKMRSYLRLKEHFTGDEWKQSFSTTAALFRSFGVVGDFDVSLILLREQEHKRLILFPFFKQTLFVNRSLGSKQARQDAVNFNEKDLDSFDQQFINLNLTDKEICQKIIQLSILKIEKVKELIKHFRKNAHKIRKLLKDVHSWVRISPEDFDKKFINIESLDQMLKDLGTWQDHFVFRKKIEQYIKDQAGDEEKVNLELLIKKLRTIQNEFLKKAKHKWKEVLPENGV